MCSKELMVIKKLCLNNQIDILSLYIIYVYILCVICLCVKKERKKQL